MKRSQRVTEANLPTILGYVKNIMQKKTVTFLTVKAKTLKQTNRVLNSNSSLDGHFGLCVKAIIRKEGFPKQFIALSTRNGFVEIIDIDDQVHITADKIIIKKGVYSENGKGIEVWKFA